MKILKQLFGSRQKDANTNEDLSMDISSPLLDSVSIDENLFVENTPPDADTGTLSSQGTKNTTGYGAQIEEFATESLASTGFKAGYMHHNPDPKKSKIREIKSEFQSLCKLEIERLRLELGELNTNIEMLEHEDMLEGTKAGLRNRKAEYDAAILRLQEEVYIAEDGLGLVRKAVDTYSEGFNRGYQLYLNEEYLNQKYRSS